MDLYALEYGQDDPTKCTARKMVRMEMVRSVNRKFHASDSTVVLNPYGHRTISPDDRGVKGILVLDCSWNQAKEVFFRKLGGKHRRLPGLLAANPTNYSRLGILKFLEALPASLFILGDVLRAEELLAPYNWSPTFKSLNEELLESYRNAS